MWDSCPCGPRGTNESFLHSMYFLGDTSFTFEFEMLGKKHIGNMSCYFWWDWLPSNFRLRDRVPKSSHSITFVRHHVIVEKWSYALHIHAGNPFQRMYEKLCWIRPVIHLAPHPVLHSGLPVPLDSQQQDKNAKAIPWCCLLALELVPLMACRNSRRYW